MTASKLYAARLRKFRQLLKKQSLRAFLVTKPVNVTYLTGFSGDDSYLLVTGNDAVILSDARFDEQLEEECPGWDREIRLPGTSLLDLIDRTAGKWKLGHLGIEAESVSVALYELIDSRLTATTLVPRTGLIEELRMIKDTEEIKLIRQAIWIAERAMQVIRATLRGDQTEAGIAAEIEYWIRQFGGSGCSFPSIVAVGSRAALPHAVPTSRRIEQSDFVLTDWGAKWQGYASDLTRILVTGRISPKLERVYGVVLNAQDRAIKTIGPGVLMSDVDAAARNAIAEAGFGKHFGHGLGHGIGLEIHEAPRMAVNTDQPLQAGMVVTVEPGVYLPGWGGVRIEDDVLVTDDGYEVLSTLPKDLDRCVVS
jgi:Xaa-Pro aminopeptidase